MSDEIRVWKVGEIDWIAARSADEAKQCLFEMTEGDGKPTPQWEEEYLDGEEPRALDTEEMERMTVCLKEPGEPGFEESKVTYRRGLELMIQAGEKFPCHFATSEY